MDQNGTDDHPRNGSKSIGGWFEPASVVTYRGGDGWQRGEDGGLWWPCTQQLVDLSLQNNKTQCLGKGSGGRCACETQAGTGKSGVGGGVPCGVGGRGGRVGVGRKGKKKKAG